MENKTEISKPEAQTAASSTWRSGTGLFLSGAVLPLGSLAFYRKAADKNVLSALLFFLLFTLTITTLSTIGLARNLFSVTNQIQEAYREGIMPEIIIQDGAAQVDAPQPFVIVDQLDSAGKRLILMTDTSGETAELDRARYSQGFLLTARQLHILNDSGEYQVVELADLHGMFGKNPIVINAETAQKGWASFSVIFSALAFVFLAIWHSIIRLSILAMYALVVWGVAALIRPGVNFNTVINTGIYALVPAIYISHLFSRAGFTFPGLQSFFLFVFWTIGLTANLANRPFLSVERPLRLWTALIGLPMLILFSADMVWQIPSPYGPIILWGVALFTIFALGGVRLYFRYKDNESAKIPAI